ncbi:MSHA biogenesis protein MshP [Photobacterium swingsii]|uniref:MSHA biogenesis protein MshP n=1 Tax=Photobacterium swingsii TaxID=680026 RepID=UPI00352F2286
MSYKKQQGSALVMSLVVITVMAVFAAALVKLDWSNQEMTSREVFATQAWFAAHSANEYALTQLFPLGSKQSNPKTCLSNYPISADKFACSSVSASCTATTITENGKTINHYQLEATATCGTGKYAVTRIQETWAKDLSENK